MNHKVASFKKTHLVTCLVYKHHPKLYLQFGPTLKKLLVTQLFNIKLKKDSDFAYFFVNVTKLKIPSEIKSQFYLSFLLFIRNIVLCSCVSASILGVPL